MQIISNTGTSNIDTGSAAYDQSCRWRADGIPILTGQWSWANTLNYRYTPLTLAHLHPSAGNEPSGGGRHCQTAKTCFRWADVVFGPMGPVVFTETPKDGMTKYRVDCILPARRLETDRKWLIRFPPKRKCTENNISFSARNRNETENLRSFSAENENETSRPT